MKSIKVLVLSLYRSDGAIQDL